MKITIDKPRKSGARKFLENKGYGSGTNFTLLGVDNLLEEYGSLKSADDNRELVDMMKRVSKVIDNHRSDDIPFDVYQVWHQMNELIQKHTL